MHGEFFASAPSARRAEAWKWALFSNTFPKLVAPGVSVLSAAMGGGLKTMSGTSMACPHAAEVAALWVETLMTGSRKPAIQGDHSEVDLVRSKGRFCKRLR